MVEGPSYDERTSIRAEMSGASSIFITWLVAGACNALSLQRSFGFSASATRIVQHAFDAGHFIALRQVQMPAGQLGVEELERLRPGQRRVRPHRSLRVTAERVGRPLGTRHRGHRGTETVVKGLRAAHPPIIGPPA
jgi:hypothetical protein